MRKNDNKLSEQEKAADQVKQDELITDHSIEDITENKQTGSATTYWLPIGIGIGLAIGVAIDKMLLGLVFGCLFGVLASVLFKKR